MNLRGQLPVTQWPGLFGAGAAGKDTGPYKWARSVSTGTPGRGDLLSPTVSRAWAVGQCSDEAFGLGAQLPRAEGERASERQKEQKPKL